MTTLTCEDMSTGAVLQIVMVALLVTVCPPSPAVATTAYVPGSVGAAELPSYVTPHETPVGTVVMVTGFGEPSYF